MFDTTKDLRRVIIDTQKKEKLVNDYKYKQQHNRADLQWNVLLIVLVYLTVIGIIGGVITWGILIINGVCYA